MQIPNSTFKRVGQLLSLTFVMLFLWSCEDEPAQIGEEIFGGNLIDTKIFITSGDTLTAKNTTLDTVDFNGINYLMLGEYNDPIYGSMKADFVSELSIGIPKENTDSDTIEYVGAELRLQYQRASWIGDTIAKHKVFVYELEQPLDPEYDYKSNFDPTGLYYPDPIGVLDTFVVKDGARDTLWQESGYTHRVAIKIDDEVGQRIFDADSITVNNAESFKNLFKGVYITSEKQNDNSPGSILRIPYTAGSNLSQDLAVIYRKKKKVTGFSGQDSIAYDTIPMLFPINKEVTKAIRYRHNYLNADINFVDGNADKIYLQGMGGTQGKINISNAFIAKWEEILTDPKLNNDNNDLITSIASVEMNFYVDTITDTNYNTNLPEALELYVLNDKGNYVTPTFETPQGTSVIYSGGVPEMTADGAIKYTFSMKNGFFEEFIYPSISANSQKEYQELFIGIRNPKFNFNRVVLHGMGIEKGNPNKSIKPSNITVKYITVD